VVGLSISAFHFTEGESSKNFNRKFGSRWILDLAFINHNNLIDVLCELSSHHHGEIMQSPKRYFGRHLLFESQKQGTEAKFAENHHRNYCDHWNHNV